jgi:hypothetical protein
VLNHVAKTAGVESNDWRLAQQRLHCNQAESFFRRRDDDSRGALVKPRQFGLRELPVPANARSDP